MQTMRRRAGQGTGPSNLRAARGRRAVLAMAVMAAAAAATTAACGDRAGDEDTSAAITVLRPWVRPAIAMDDSAAAPVNTAAYMIIQNPTPNADALVGVETTVAGTAELHSVTMDEGVMRMRQVDAVDIPDAGEAVLEPGGYHIMLIGLHQALAEGDTVPLRLTLRGGRTIDVAAPVRQTPPGAS